ncbi:SAM-dependent methyltransferase [Streptomyces sp. NPDC021020]|uniref:SAM-dependent methyltransferase n=1 Tax=Streptomyces sp. NPDC021020 TaxID=3365109 RepID=UPI0037B34739
MDSRSGETTTNRRAAPLADQGFTAEEIDTSRPHPARMYDYYLGGKDNYEVDREAAQQVIQLLPDAVPSARANRAFMHRAVRFTAESGIRQFIDIGTGIPTSPNTHQVAQAVSPDVRVAYVDNDPIVATHAGAHLLGAGNTGFFLGDLRDPQSILGHPTIGKLIDFDQPVGLMLVAILHFIRDDEDPAALVAAYRDALPKGSYLLFSHVTADFHDPGTGSEEAADVYRQSRATATFNLRSSDQIMGLLEGFELVEPGLAQLPLWRPDGPTPDRRDLAGIGGYGAVGVKL